MAICCCLDTLAETWSENRAGRPQTALLWRVLSQAPRQEGQETDLTNCTTTPACRGFLKLCSQQFLHLNKCPRMVSEVAKKKLLDPALWLLEMLSELTLRWSLCGPWPLLCLRVWQVRKLSAWCPGQRPRTRRGNSGQPQAPPPLRMVHTGVANANPPKTIGPRGRRVLCSARK